MAAGRQFGIRSGGYRVLDSLRMEKGYRYYGTDLTLLDNPFEAGRGFCVQMDKGDFNAREALVAARESGIKRRLRTLAIGTDDYLPVYGGEAVHSAWPGGRPRAQLRLRLHREAEPRVLLLADGDRAGRHCACGGLRTDGPGRRDLRRCDFQRGSDAVTTRQDEVANKVSLWRGKEVNVSQLSGGLTNENFLVEAGGERYVMRVPGQSTELLAIDRENEVYNTKAAATTGIGPRVLEHVPGLDILVLEFIPGKTMSAGSLQSTAMAGRIAASFHRLHDSPRFLKDFNMFRLIEQYLAIVEEHGVTIPDRYRDWLPAVGRIEEAVAANALPSVPCHNDLLCENFIDDGTALRIVDYELSGNNDPCFDLGNTAQEAQFDQVLRASLCAAYFGQRRCGAACPDEPFRVDVRCRVDPLGCHPGQDLGGRLRFQGLLHDALEARPRGARVGPA